MSEIQAAFRQLGGEALDSLTDDELTLFIGQNFPQLKNHPKFGTEYSAVKEDRDTSIIEGLQLDIADEQTQLQKPSTLNFVERLGLGMVQGTANVVKSVGAANQAAQVGGTYLTPAMNIPLFRKGVEAVTGRARKVEEEFSEAGAALGGGLPSEFAQALGAGSASIVPSVVAAYFGGMPAAMATAGALQFGDTYDTAVQAYVAQGRTREQAHEEALKPAILSGVVTAGLTSIGGAERFFSRLARGKIAQNTARVVLKEIIKSAGLEGVEEGADQFIQGFIQRATFEPEKTFPQIAKESAMAAAVGMTLGAVLPGASMLARKAKASADVVGKGLPQPPGEAPPVQEVQARPARPSQVTAGELLTGREGFDLQIGGRALPISAATVQGDGSIKLDLEGGQSLGFAPDELLNVVPKKATSQAAAGAPPVIAEEGAAPPAQAEPGEAPLVIPDGAALRAFPAPVAALDAFIKWAMPRQPGAPPPIALDVDTPFPDFLPREQAKATFTQPFAAGRIPILGQAVDPNARHLTDVGEMVNTLHAEYNAGGAIASGFGVQIQGRWNSAFRAGKDGFLVGVEPTREGQSLAPSDVLESLLRDPASYRISAEQEAVLEEIRSSAEQVKGLLQKYGIGDLASDDGESGNPEGYFPRIVIERPKKETKLGRGGRMGGKPFFEKSRVFKTEADGIRSGYRYEPSIERRFTTYVQKAYRRIAEKRFTGDPDLEKLPVQVKAAELRQAMLPLVADGTMTLDGMEQAIANKLAEMTPGNRAFSGFVYPPETVEELNRAFPNTSSAIRQHLVNANNFIKMLRLGYDLGVMFNQGLITFFGYPKQWAQGAAMSIRSMLNPTALSHWANNNIEVIRERAQLGSSVGRLAEYLAGAERGQILERLPGVGPVTQAFARQFQTFMDVAATEIYKSYRNVVRPDERLQLTRAVESVLLSGRMEAIGVGPNQAFVERALLLAPSYYRGAINLVGLIGSKGISGRIAARALGAYGAGGLFLFAALARALGMDWEEIEKRLNPTNSEFMNWRLPLENGNVVNFGLGGIMKSFIKLLANTAKTAFNEPEKFTKGTSQDNPLVRWYRAHSAPGPSIAWDLFSGRDYMGGETDTGVIFGGLLPLSIQSLLARNYGRERSTEEKATTVAVESLGISTHHESFGRSRMAELDRIAGEQAKKKYSELTVNERGKALSEFEGTPTEKGKPELPAGLTERLDKQNLSALNKALSDDAQDFLKKSGLKLSPPRLYFRAGGRNIVITEDERTRFIELIADETSMAIGKNAKRLEKLDEEKREPEFRELVIHAKAKALARLKKELPNAE